MFGCPVRSAPLAPGTYTVASRFGEGSNGVDLDTATDAPVHSALDGTVVAAGPATGFGHWIVIDSSTSTGTVST
ncbi:MAG TPA: M23 family metallopeptidase, partial [Aldersonia sp.]